MIQPSSAESRAGLRGRHLKYLTRPGASEDVEIQAYEAQVPQEHRARQSGDLSGTAFDSLENSNFGSARDGAYEVAPIETSL